MANFNSVQLIGRLTRDPELKSLPGGSNVVKFGLAVNRYYKDGDGERKEATDFIDCEFWGNRAKVFSDNTKKGSQIFVYGSLKQDSWEDKSSGEKRSRLIVRVDNFEFLDPRNKSEDNDGGGEEEPPRKPAANKFQGNQKKSNIPF